MKKRAGTTEQNGKGSGRTDAPGYGFRELAALAEMSREIYSARTTGELLEILVEKAVIGVNFERGLIYLVEGDYLRCAASLDRVRRERGLTLKKRVGFRLGEKSLETLAVAENRPQMTEDAPSDPRIGEKYKRILDSDRYCVVPLPGRDGVLGVFTGDKHYSREPITGGDVDTLGLFAGHIGLALENARLHEEAKRFNRLLGRTVRERTAELKEANMRLKGKIKELSTMFGIGDTLNEPILLSELKARIVALVESLGYGLAALHLAGADFGIPTVTEGLGGDYPSALGREGLMRLEFGDSGKTVPSKVDTGWLAKGGAASFFRKKGIVGCVRAPVPLGDKTLASIYVYLREGEDVSDEGLRFLGAFAKQAAVPLERALGLEKVKRELEEAEKATVKLEREMNYIKGRMAPLFGSGSIIGSDGGLKETMSLLAKVAPTGATVTLFGETGTGKELLARALHDMSTRRKNPFIAVNCAAIPDDLLESELFGHEKGAFTGAIRKKPGLFELAHQGTIFLDEIGEISPKIQAKLLRVLEDQEIRRVGGESQTRVDARVVAATNRRMDDGAFRSDFLYRLTVFPVHVPPLRERLEDIPGLASHFLEKYGKGLPRKPGVSTDALRVLMDYSWPGNVRELENVIERLVIITGGGLITAGDLPADIVGKPSGGNRIVPLSQTLAAFRNEAVRKALKAAGGKKSEAARLLGMPRSNFSRLLKAIEKKRQPLNSNFAAAVS